MAGEFVEASDDRGRIAATRVPDGYEVVHRGVTAENDLTWSARRFRWVKLQPRLTVSRIFIVIRRLSARA